MDWEGRVTLIETHRAQGRPVSPPPERKPGRHYLSNGGEAQGRSMGVAVPTRGIADREAPTGRRSRGCQRKGDRKGDFTVLLRV
jgi:hypothetical protein